MKAIDTLVRVRDRLKGIAAGLEDDKPAAAKELLEMAGALSQEVSRTRQRTYNSPKQQALKDIRAGFPAMAWWRFDTPEQKAYMFEYSALVETRRIQDEIMRTSGNEKLSKIYAPGSKIEEIEIQAPRYT